MMTPRELLRDYLTVLDILMQNEQVDFNAIIARVTADSRPVGDSGDEADGNGESGSTGGEKPTFSPVDIVF